MVTVTAAELQKKFGLYRDVAQREPVSVTHHGRDSLVVLSADEYKRLKALDDRTAYAAGQIPDDVLDELEKADPPAWTKDLDHLMDN